MMTSDMELPVCPIFDPLTPEQRRELLGLMKSHRFAPGQVILEEGERTGGIWIITEGRCEVVKRSVAGKESSLAELGPGSIFGEMSFFQPMPHSATVRSLTPVVALELTTERYRQLEREKLRIAHTIAHSVAIVLSERLRRMDDWTSELIAQSPNAKHDEWADFRAQLYNNWGF